MNEEIHSITNIGKTAKNEWKGDDPEFLWAFAVYTKEWGQFFFHAYLLTCLNWDTLVLLKVINFWASQ